MKYHIKLLLVISILSLTGCATYPNGITSDVRKNIKSVNIKILPTPHTPSIYTAEQEIAGLTTFMFAGSQASMHAQEEAAKTPSAQFGKYLAENNISVEKIVENELKKQLKSTRLYKVNSKSKSDAIITIKIGAYGFAQKSLWSSYQRTQLYLYADITNRKNEILAKIIGFASPFRDEKAMTFEEIFKNPKDVRESFEKSAVVAVKDIIEKMTLK